MSKTYTLIGGPLHRKVMALNLTSRSVEFPSLDHSALYASMSRPMLDPFAAPMFTREVYRIHKVELYGVEIAQVLLHDTVGTPPRLIIR